MATYLVVTTDKEGNDFVYPTAAKSQRDAAAQILDGIGDKEARVYTLAKGSPVSTFRRRTETVTVLERVSDDG